LNVYTYLVLPKLAGLSPGPEPGGGDKEESRGMLFFLLVVVGHVVAVVVLGRSRMASGLQRRETTMAWAACVLG